MRIRLRVRPQDFDELEFESYSGVMTAVDGLRKSLRNTDWLAAGLEERELKDALTALDRLGDIFTPLVEGEPHNQIEKIEIEVTPPLEEGD